MLGKGLDISLAALQQHDPYISSIVDVASQVALYTFGHRANEWVRAGPEPRSGLPRPALGQRRNPPPHRAGPGFDLQRGVRVQVLPRQGRGSCPGSAPRWAEGRGEMHLYRLRK